ncbi:MAG: hypothetical protein Q4D58_11470 [Synergistaceae bacterium]|nr:hypothetical protein [Synergistaceae bacterium]
MAVHDFTNKNGGGGLGGWLGPLSILASLVPGGQALTPWISGAGAVASAIDGDWTGAAKQAVGALGGAEASSGKAFAPKLATQMESNPGYLSQQLSALNQAGGAASGTVSDGFYDELLTQYGLSDMDWTERQRRNRLTGGI